MTKERLLEYVKTRDELEFFIEKFCKWWDEKIQNNRYSYWSELDVKGADVRINCTDKYGDGYAITCPIDLLFLDEPRKDNWVIRYKIAEKQKKEEIAKERKQREKEQKAIAEKEEHELYLKLKNKYEENELKYDN